MISQTFNFFEEMCFDRFLHFYSIVFVRSLWLWLSRGGTQSCGRPPLLRIVALCMCIIRYATYSSFSSPSFYSVIFFLHHSIGTIPWVISIYLLNKCARSWSSLELLGKVASLTTTTSIIPLAVRVIGIELLFLMY